MCKISCRCARITSFYQQAIAEKTMKSSVVVAVSMFSTALAVCGLVILSGVGRRKCEEAVERRRKRAHSVQNPFHRIVEICVSDFVSAKEAVEGGASSLELCSNRMEGGTTPSIGLIEQCVDLAKGTNVVLQVLIRPRPGDFNYTNEEFEIIQRDIIAARMTGADGIVCGILTPDGKVDMPRMAIVRKLSEGMMLTFHRAFDICSDMELALDSIIMCNCDRLLTSGQSTSVVDAVENGKLEEIIKHTQGMVHVIAGAGVTIENVHKIVSKSFVAAVHAGSAVTSPRSCYTCDSYVDTVNLVSGNSCIAPEMVSYMCVHSDLVRQLVENADKAWNELHMA
ncbi:copper homeostasis protein CutC [archaeon]|nr:MAG: copper homeostasis protein CutC [archaeon]